MTVTDQDKVDENTDVAARTQTILAADAGPALRKKLGLTSDAQMRIAYVPGPGDVIGTFGNWRNNQHDPRVPVFTYSSMFYELLEKLNAQGLLVTRHPATDPVPDAPDQRVSFQRLIKKPDTGFAGYWRREATYGRALMRHVEKFDPHIVVVSTDVPWFFWPKLGKNRICLLSAHNTFWLMGAPPTRALTKLRLWLTARAMSGLSGAVCTSDECARQIDALSKGTVPTWTEIPQQKRSYAIVRSRKTVRHICFVGRIVMAKGMHMLIDAFSKVARDRPDMTLTFAGSGIAEDALNARIAELRDTRIRFPGRLPAADVHMLLDNSDLLVCPTRTDFAEGLGLVVAEAAAHGVPSVVSSVVPARDLFTDACATFPANDTAALTDILETLVHSPDLYQALCDGTAQNRDIMLDRSRSWGSQLVHAMLGAR
jgi:glycogen(starch) synthase